jgi:hypothetical protein
MEAWTDSTGCGNFCGIIGQIGFAPPPDYFISRCPLYFCLFIIFLSGSDTHGWWILGGSGALVKVAETPMVKIRGGDAITGVANVCARGYLRHGA